MPEEYFNLINHSNLERNRNSYQNMIMCRILWFIIFPSQGSSTLHWWIWSSQGIRTKCLHSWPPQIWCYPAQSIDPECSVVQLQHGLLRLDIQHTYFWSESIPHVLNSWNCFHCIMPYWTVYGKQVRSLKKANINVT